MTAHSRKALFLDRDGVINVNHGYVCTKDNFDFIDGVFDLVKRANQLNYLVIVVTNQSGIGRGYYSEDEFLALSEWMKGEFSKRNATIDAIYYCPNHPTEAKPPYLKECNYRKPKAGMAEQAQRDFNISLTDSIMVGDSVSDIEFAVNASIQNVYYLTTDSSKSEQVKARFPNTKTIEDLQSVAL